MERLLVTTEIQISGISLAFRKGKEGEDKIEDKFDIDFELARGTCTESDD